MCACAYEYICICVHAYICSMKVRIKGCEEKHSHTTAHHPVVKPPAVVSTAVSHTPTQQQDGGNYQELSLSISPSSFVT